MYELKIKKRVFKTLEEIDEAYYSKIEAAIYDLADDPHRFGYLILKGNKRRVINSQRCCITHTITIIQIAGTIRRRLFYINIMDYYFTLATSCLKVSGSFIARSASTLRLRSMPLTASLPMN